MTSAASARGVRACGSATVSGGRRVLAGGSLLVGQQAQRAVALPAEQPPASIPSSPLEWTSTGSAAATLDGFRFVAEAALSP